MLPAADAAALCRQLEEHGVRFWLIGGWGVDALLHRQTRPHKDLDVLVRLADLRALRRLLDGHGFTRTLVWEENRWVEEADGPWPTAFVATDPAGRALDVHLVDVGGTGGSSSCTTPRGRSRTPSTGPARSTGRRCRACRCRPSGRCTPATSCPTGTGRTSSCSRDLA